MKQANQEMTNQNEGAEKRVIIPRYNPDWRDFSQAVEEHGMQFEYDIRGNSIVVHWSELHPFSESQMFLRLPNGGFRLTDHIDEFMRLEFNRLTLKEWESKNNDGEIEIKRANWVLGAERWHSFLGAHLIDKHVDYFKRWLESLVWDGTPRLENMLVEVFDEVRIHGDLTERQRFCLLRWASQAPLLGAVWRTYQPGYKNDCMVILVGSQGIGKSTIYRESFPPPWQRFWYRDNVSLSASKQKWVEEMGSGVIVEVAEMSGMSRRDVAELKAALSSLFDVVRLAYGHHPIEKPRQYQMVGTTNVTEQGILPYDTSGNRRFFPVHVNGHPDHVNGYMRANREQLWAEAKAKYDDGEHAYMTFQMEQWAKETQADAMEDKISEFGRKVREGCFTGVFEPDEKYTLQEIAQLVGAVKPVTRPQDEERVANQDYSHEPEYEPVGWHNRRTYLADLRLLGWENKRSRRDGIRDYYLSFSADNKHCTPQGE